MTISSPATPLSYAGNDSVVDFAITWVYIEKSHVSVILRGTDGTEIVQVLDTDYGLTDPGTTGTLTMVEPPATGETLVITSEPPNTQETDIPLGGPLPARAVEDGLDLASQVSQKIETKIDRALRVPKTDTRSGDQLELPNETDRANNLLAFDGNGDPIATSAGVGVAIVSPFMETVLDDTTDSAARTTLGASSLSPMAHQVKNLGMSFGVNASALTMTLTTAAGATPTVADPVEVSVRSSVLATGTHSAINVTATQTLVISSGSTLGHTDATAGTIHWYLINNAGTLELGASTTFHGLSGIVTTLAEGGAGAADSSTEMYSTTARAAVAYLWIGQSEDTQTTAGTWAALPTSVQMVKETEGAAAATTADAGIAELITSAELLTDTPDTSRILTADALRASLYVRTAFTTVGTGTTLDITGLVAWINKYTIFFEDLSTDGTGELYIQLGDATTGALVTSGYKGSTVSLVNSALTAKLGTGGAWLESTSATAAFVRQMSIEITLVDVASFTYSIAAYSGLSSAARVMTGFSMISLAGFFDRWTVQTDAADNFDGGEYATQYH